MSDWKESVLATLRGKANQVLAHNPLVLGQEELQLAVERRFPVTVDSIVPITLQNPYVRLQDGSDHLGLEVEVAAQITQGYPFTSRWLLTGQITYDRQLGEFYLYQPDIRSLDPGSIFEAFNAPGMVRELFIEEILGGLMAKMPLYRLQPNNPRHALAKRWLRSLRVDNGRLLVQLRIE
jgi:hypothetical protein